MRGWLGAQREQHTLTPWQLLRLAKLPTSYNQAKLPTTYPSHALVLPAWPLSTVQTPRYKYCEYLGFIGQGRLQFVAGCQGALPRSSSLHSAR